MLELITGPLVMAFGAVLVLMGVYGIAPWPWQARRPAANTQVGLGRRVAGAATAAAAAGRGARTLVARTLAGERPAEDAAAIADDMIAALLSELLTLREEVDGLRAQIDAPTRATTTRRREPSPAATKAAGRRLASARSA